MPRPTDCSWGATAHLRSFLRKRLGRLPEEIEDLVQELLLAIHNQRHTYDARQPLTAWVHAIARYIVLGLVTAAAFVPMSKGANRYDDGDSLYLALREQPHTRFVGLAAARSRLFSQTVLRVSI